MGYSNSSLATVKNLFNQNYNVRTQKIDRITIHHMAGNGTIYSCRTALLSRGGSVNYAIQSDGTIGLLLEEKYRAWTSSSPENDYRAVTIEVANAPGAGEPDWKVTDAALEAVIKLCVDICKRNGIAKLTFTGSLNGSNMTMHKWFASTGCPGPYLSSKFPYIRDEVNRRLGKSSDTGNGKKTDDNKKTDTNTSKVPYLVKITCKGGLNVRTGAGINNSINKNCKLVPYGGVYTIVETKTVSGQVWGKLKSGAGWICLTGYTEVYKKATNGKKSVDEIAKEVIQGRWGNGTDRVRKLTDAGYDYNTVQRRVNEMLGLG